MPGDHSRSSMKITDGSGNVVASNDFYPFGLPAATTGLQGSWFAGYELEHQNTSSTYTDDLYFLHARWYFPQVARFLSPDPVRGDVFSPQSFNLFAYVSGNPANFVDPWGLAALDPLAQQGNSYMFSEQVTVTAAHPCPGAPKELSCEAWQSVKEMQWRMILGWNRPLSQTPALFPTPTSPNMRAARPEEVARSAESLSSTERAPELVFGGGLKVTFAFPILGKKVPLLLVGEASWQPWTVVKLEASVQSGLGTPSVAGGLFFFLQNAGFGNEPSSGFSIFGGRGWGGGLSVLLENKYLGRAEVLFGGGVGLAGTVPVYVYPLGAREWGH
ncbi:hypothetical protein EG19_09405 [Thermoanaerobaculum aquaticum]|uniref:RHS repeat-associated core domain-containing protein n=1 Tax=Thermoanaerobaculum aquaticum TaxID=1312852 RepID=A0A062XU41_9BACT|nr:hypothetical protein EG19_09405 [Thermoanaerobaculum aquaticum]